MTTANDEPQILLKGTLVSLGPMRKSEIPLLTRWHNDPITLLLGGDDLIPTTEARSEALWTKFIEEENDKRIFFTMYENRSMRQIGMCNLRDINVLHGTGELGILIGDAGDRGKGYGSETVALLADYGFTAFGLVNIWLDTLSANKAGIRAYEKAGFKEIGRRRGSHRIGTQVYDTVLMDCIPADFYALHESMIENPYK
jgi:RimJ/RimL family protein N-acetyltransferase